MSRFISADWGTTHLRLRLVGQERRELLYEVWSKAGIAATYAAWKESGRERGDFYRGALRRCLDELRELSGQSLEGLPLVLSGMASSTLGMMELSYKPVPFDVNGSDLPRVWIPVTDGFRHPVLMISGASTANDVMRGEEVQLAGVWDFAARDSGSGGLPDGLYLFPGTHSKHILVKGGKAVDFSTFMTGEFFQLLSVKSILAASVGSAPEEGNGWGDATTGHLGSGARVEPFRRGVLDSRKAGLLHNAFLVRTNQLLGGWTKEDNYQYLSGLVIGEELKDLRNSGPPPTIVCTGKQRENYFVACQALGISPLNIIDADQALVRGHCRLLAAGMP